LIELARAHEQDGDAPSALATYELARWHDPRNAAVRAEVERLRASLGVADEADGWRAPFRWLTIGEWGFVLAGAAAALGGLALAHGLRRTPAPGRRRGKAVAASLVVMIAAAVTGLVVQASRLDEAIVHVQGAPLFVSPTSAAQSVGALRAGERVRIEGAHRSYVQVRTRAGLLGWLPDATVTPLKGMPPAPAAPAAKEAKEAKPASQRE
jgi:hypothetical protein